MLAVAQLAVDATRRARGEQVSAGHLGLELAAAIPVGGSAVRGLRAAGDVTHLVPGGGLMAHEGLDGGHTLAKHVGKSEEFLRNRLATEPASRPRRPSTTDRWPRSAVASCSTKRARGERWL